MKFIRMVKAIAGTAAVWGAAWSLTSVPTLIFLMRSNQLGTPRHELFLSWAVNAWPYAFLQGAVVGVGFATLLAVLSRVAPTIGQLTFPRVGLLGAAASYGLAVLVLGPFGGLLDAAVLGGIGAGTAMLSLAVARRAPAGELEAEEAVPQLPAG